MAASAFPPRCILIVEDDAEIARAVALRITRFGFLPLIAANGAEGLSTARSRLPAAVIVDLRMPVMDGFAFLAELGRSARTASIPAIVLSADADQGAKLKAIAGGAAYFVEKPYRSDDLLLAVNAALARARPDLIHDLRGSDA